MAKWTVWTLDVWGNPDDGYEVNDRCNVGTVELHPVDSSDCTDGHILGTLQREKYLSASLSTIDVAVDGDDRILFVDATADGRPLLQLTCEES